MALIFILMIITVLTSSVLTIYFISKTNNKSILEYFVLLTSFITSVFLIYLLLANVYSFIQSTKVQVSFEDLEKTNLLKNSSRL
jgi:hypothetical protein